MSFRAGKVSAGTFDLRCEMSNIFGLLRLANTEKGSERCSVGCMTKEDFSPLACLEGLPSICQSCTISKFLSRAVCHCGKTIQLQEHHDLADEFGVWHVMCMESPGSCMGYAMKVVYKIGRDRSSASPCLDWSSHRGLTSPC